MLSEALWGPDRKGLCWRRLLNLWNPDRGWPAGPEKSLGAGEFCTAWFGMGSNSLGHLLLMQQTLSSRAWSSLKWGWAKANNPHSRRVKYSPKANSFFVGLFCFTWAPKKGGVEYYRQPIVTQWFRGMRISTCLVSYARMEHVVSYVVDLSSLGLFWGQVYWGYHFAPGRRDRSAGKSKLSIFCIFWPIAAQRHWKLSTSWAWRLYFHSHMKLAWSLRNDFNLCEGSEPTAPACPTPWQPRACQSDAGEVIHIYNIYMYIYR